MTRYRFIFMDIDVNVCRCDDVFCGTEQEAINTARGLLALLRKRSVAVWNGTQQIYDSAVTSMN